MGDRLRVAVVVAVGAGFVIAAVFVALAISAADISRAERFLWWAAEAFMVTFALASVGATTWGDR